MPPMDPPNPNMPDPPIEDDNNINPPIEDDNNINPNPSDPNQGEKDFCKIKISSLKDIFVLSTDITMFFALFWCNWWVIFVWF